MVGRQEVAYEVAGLLDTVTNRSELVLRKRITRKQKSKIAWSMLRTSLKAMLLTAKWARPASVA